MQGLRIGILLADIDNPFWREHLAYYEKLLPHYGMDAVFLRAEDTLDVQAQVEALEAALWGAQRPSLDAIIVNPLDAQGVAYLLASRHVMLPIFDVGPKCNADVVRHVKQYFPLYMADFEEQGRLCTQVLLSQITERGPFCCIGGFATAHHGQMRVRGAMTAAQQAGLPIIHPVWSDFTRQGGYEAMKKLLPHDPTAVYCANDLMALGALDALKELYGPRSPRKAGMPILVGGTDAIFAAREAVAQGFLCATVGMNAEKAVHVVLQAVHDFLIHKIVPSKAILLQTEIVTRESHG